MEPFVVKITDYEQNDSFEGVVFPEKKLVTYPDFQTKELQPLYNLTSEQLASLNEGGVVSYPGIDIEKNTAISFEEFQEAFEQAKNDPSLWEEVGSQGGQTLENLLETYDQMIEEHGFAGVYIYDTERDFEESAFSPYCYTIGLDLRDMPELIMFGLPAEAPPVLTNLVVEYWQENGVVFGDIDGLLSDYPLRLVEIIPDGELMHHIGPYRAHKGYDPHFRAVQVIWPDTEGNFVESELQPFLPELEI